jgi:hypothetical protein
MATTRAYWEKHSYLIDPHTAVCLAAAEVAGLPRPGTVRAKTFFNPACLDRTLRYPMILDPVELYAGLLVNGASMQVRRGAA